MLRTLRTSLALLASALAGLNLHAAIKTEIVEYRQGDTVLEGFLAYDDARSGTRPGIVVVHQWKGLSDHEKQRAIQLAGLGYVAFAADIYGKGIRPATPQDAGKEAGKYKADRPLLRSRVQAAVDRLRQCTQTDPQRIGAIGYCFGGTTVLELARSGADIRAVVSFHGGLGTPTPADARNIRARVLACHGADDPFVPAEEVSAFQKEMRDGGVDWQLVAYGGAVHSFTMAAETGTPNAGSKYHAAADRRSWEAMKAFLNEAFSTSATKP